MENRDTLGWCVVGINWYSILIFGGLYVFFSGLIMRMHDIWLIVLKERDFNKYHISNDPKRLSISFVTLFLGLIIIVMIITLILPILMGFQHLVRTFIGKINNKTQKCLTKTQDGKKWYDGIIYATGVDPGSKDVRAVIYGLLHEGTQVVDICCGTGELSFLLSKKCKRVLGLDHSSKMISHANKEKKSRGIENVSFAQTDAMNLTELQDKEFDYSILSLTLHEMEPLIRENVLREAKRISKQIIIIDFNVPTPMNREGLRALFFEFVAGYDHFKNYLRYRDKGGIDYMLDKVELEKGHVVTIKKNTLSIVMAE